MAEKGARTRRDAGGGLFRLHIAICVRDRRAEGVSGGAPWSQEMRVAAQPQVSRAGVLPADEAQPTEGELGKEPRIRREARLPSAARVPVLKTVAPESGCAGSTPRDSATRTGDPTKKKVRRAH